MDVERMIWRAGAVAAALVLAACLAGAAEPSTTPTPTPTPKPAAGIAERPEGEPIFFRWLDAEDPVDATILEYWHRYEAGRLTPREMVDLGTMLYRRGWPKDAVRVYREAGKADPTLYDAWLRAGLAEHSQRRFGKAKKYYKKCLKVLVGNGWCNFYMGLAEEQSYNGTAALKYYKKAFEVAPELANARDNPALLQSKIARAAAIAAEGEDQFASSMPMSYLQPDEVERTRLKYESRSRKLQMWNTQAEGARQGAREAGGVPPPGNGQRPPAVRRPAATQPRPPGHAVASPAPPHPVSRQRPEAPPKGAEAAKNVHRPAPLPTRPAPAPPVTGSGRVYPWGGGPIPPQSGAPAATRTPVQQPTPAPAAK